MKIESLPPYFADWICSKIGSQAEILSFSQIQGSTSSELLLIHVREGAHFFDLVLRLLTDREWLTNEPDLAEHEANALQLACKSGLPVPEVVAWDATGINYGIPVILMTYLPGVVNLQPVNFDDWLRQMAEALIPIHTQDAAELKWEYYPYNDPKVLKVPNWTSIPQLWKRAIDLVNQPAPVSRVSFIHRDYHPMNTLWQDQTLCGIVDWINACRGPTSIDVAWMRLNLMSMYGVKAADQFLEFYLSLSGENNSYHPYWDLMALIELLPGPPSVYEPWPIFGLHGLSTPLLIKRADEYLVSILENW